MNRLRQLLQCLSLLCALLVFASCEDEMHAPEAVVPEEEIPAYVNAAKSLSAGRQANCYIVSKEGTYRFTPYKGNSKAHVEGVASARVLWESFGTDQKPSVGALVRDVEYIGGYIVFKTSEVFTEGNAVIAAEDANGKILWSWHIWLTDYPQGQLYYNNAGTMMDRNLGATSATPGDVCVLGLKYQWGRKDPFLGWKSAVATNSWPAAVESKPKTGTIAYATANPMTLIAQGPNYDWLYTGGATSIDATRWKGSGSPKTIYDPCPYGWRVPDGGSKGVWATATGSFRSFSLDWKYDKDKFGVNLSKKLGAGKTIWYPVSGMYWAATISDAMNADCLDLTPILASPSWQAYPAKTGYVRCVKE